MLERLPIHGGLLWYGVAPDHIEIKEVINNYDSLFANNNFKFFGNYN